MKYLLEAYQSSYHMPWESALASPDYPIAATGMGYIPIRHADNSCTPSQHCERASCLGALGSHATNYARDGRVDHCKWKQKWVWVRYVLHTAL